MNNRFKIFKSSEEAFTLIEVVTAITIITIALLALISYFSNSIGFVQQVNIRSQALKLAKDSVEIVKTYAINDWDNLETASTTLTMDDISSGYDLLTSDYQLFINISNVDNLDFDRDGINGDGDGKKITARISWNNDNREVVLETLVRER